MELHLWSDLPTTVGAVATTVLVYVAVLVAVRVAGRRTTAQISAYDVLVTVALGTSLASTSLPSEPAVGDGLAVLVTLLALQVLIGAARRRSARARRLVDFAPIVVVRRGGIERGSGILSAQLTDSDVEAELRKHGVTALDDVAVLVLEADGRTSLRRVRSSVADGPPWQSVSGA